MILLEAMPLNHLTRLGRFEVCIQCLDAEKKGYYSSAEVPTFTGTFGILSLGNGQNHEIAATGGGANHTVSGSKVMHNSTSKSSVFQAEALFIKPFS